MFGSIFGVEKIAVPRGTKHSVYNANGFYHCSMSAHGTTVHARGKSHNEAIKSAAQKLHETLARKSA